MDNSQENGSKKGLKPIKPVDPVVMPNIFGVKTDPMTGDRIIGRISDPPEFTEKKSK